MALIIVDIHFGELAWGGKHVGVFSVLRRMLGVSRDTIDKVTNLKLVISPKHCPQLIRKYFSIDVSHI